MTDPARPGEARPGGSVRSAVRDGLLGGALAFAVATAIGIAIGLIEFAASGGAYRLWTWVKVGFLYVVSFCTVSLRLAVAGRGDGGAVQPQTISLRFAFLSGTLLLLWLLARAGRTIARSAGGPGALAAGAAAAVVAFGLPVFAIAVPATLRFPTLIHAEVSPILWQAAAYPAALAAAGVAAGVFQERRERLAPDLVGVVRGGWRMFTLSLVLGFVGFLALAAVKSGPTGAYARELQAEGRVGVLSFTHHLLLLPNQSVWILAPAMGGSTEVSFGRDDRSVISIGRADLSGFVSALTSGGATDSVPLGGGFYLFVLVPAVATVAGGRSAARTGSNAIRRMGLGAGAGLVFALLVAAGAWASAATLPIPALSWAPVSIRAAMPATALIASIWGVVGGSIGGLSAPLRGSVAQAGVAPGSG